MDHEPPPVLIPKSEREGTEGRLLGEEVSGDRLGFVVCRFEGICGFWGEQAGGRHVSLSWITSEVLVIKGTVHSKNKFLEFAHSHLISNLHYFLSSVKNSRKYLENCLRNFYT